MKALGTPLVLGEPGPVHAVSRLADERAGCVLPVGRGRRRGQATQVCFLLSLTSHSRGNHGEEAARPGMSVRLTELSVPEGNHRVVFVS